MTEIYICATCGGEFKTKELMNEHFREVGIPIPMVELWECPRCHNIWKDHETRKYIHGLGKQNPPTCPKCIFVSLKYKGKHENV